MIRAKRSSGKKNRRKVVKKFVDRDPFRTPAIPWAIGVNPVFWAAILSELNDGKRYF
jgi:hypothetical protein